VFIRIVILAPTWQSTNQLVFPSSLLPFPDRISAQFTHLTLGGPAGSALAAGLAKVPSLKILLLEAGGNNEHIEHMAACNRYSTFMTAPGYNWKHESVPQPHMANRKLNYDAGKGLGGGTSINFGCYTRGPAQDYEDWAKITGDEQLGWKAARERLKDVETMHPPPEELEKYCKPADGAHGYTGCVTHLCNRPIS